MPTRTRTPILLALTTLCALALGTPTASANYPGHNGRFAYRDSSGPSEIWTVGKGGSGATPVTSGATGAEYPSWTPKGKAIVYDSNADGDYEIYVVSASGGAPRQITHNSSVDWAGNQGPGGRIAFVCTKASSEEICTIKTDGTGLKRLTNNHAEDWNPKWSPDGSKIVFSSDRKGSHDIFVMNSDGSHPTQLTKSSNGEFEPDYAPSGKRIVFWSDSGPSLWVMSASGRHRHMIRSASAIRTPSWAPSGSLVAFALDMDIATVHPDGSHLNHVTTGGSAGNNISWQPR
jgi:Tol biopolymer transport system component